MSLRNLLKRSLILFLKKKGREVISSQQSTSVSNSSDPESNNEDEGSPDTNAESSDVKFEDM